VTGTVYENATPRFVLFKIHWSNTEKRNQFYTLNLVFGLKGAAGFAAPFSVSLHFL